MEDLIIKQKALAALESEARKKEEAIIAAEKAKQELEKQLKCDICNFPSKRRG